MSQEDGPRLGLRERKKAKTRAAIQHEALRLFRAQGYEATTVERIAEAAEVSESTFYRYFPTKEDVVLWDEFDPLLIDAFRLQPPELTPIQAMRGAFRAGFDDLSPEQWDEQRQRFELQQSVPELRAAVADQLIDTVGVAAAVDRRAARASDERLRCANDRRRCDRGPTAVVPDPSREPRRRLGCARRRGAREA